MKSSKRTLLMSAPLLLPAVATQAQPAPPPAAPTITFPAQAVAPPNKEARLMTVYVAGGVTKPGAYKVEEGGNLLDLIALAGGLTQRAEMSNAQVQRRFGQSLRMNDLTGLFIRREGKPFLLEDGDMVTVSQNQPAPPTSPGAPPRIEIFRQFQAPGGNAPAVAFAPGIAPSRSRDNYLGAHVGDVTAESMTFYGARVPGGVALSDIIAGGPAEKAGLRKNDVVLKFEGETVSSNTKLVRLIAEAAPEGRVRLLIRRDGAEREISVTLGQRSSAPQGLFETRPQAGGRPVLPWTDPYFRVIPAPRGAPAPRAFGAPPIGAPPRGFSAPPAFPGQPGFAVPRVVPVPRADNPALRGLFATRTIGVTPAEMTDQLREFFGVAKERGVLVSSVVKDSPADKAGLKAGDVITQVDETPVSKIGDLTRAVNRKTEGDVTLTVVRDKTARTIRLTPQSAR